MPDQQHAIEELAGLHRESVHRFDQLTGQNVDVHRSAVRDRQTLSILDRPALQHGTPLGLLPRPRRTLDIQVE
jgi:hypothetical protein